jgi:precorrin-3B C17-methyltransferase
MCKYYPCHFDGQDCTFCFCPFYPCGDDSKGRWIIKKDTNEKVWDCSPCRWVHEEEFVGKIIKRLKDLKMSDVDDFERRRGEIMEIKRQINSGETR